MDITINPSELAKAFTGLRPLMDKAIQGLNVITIQTGQDMVWLSASNGLVVGCAGIPAVIGAEGKCAVAEKLDAILFHVGGDAVRLTLKNKTLHITNDAGFKGRLQTIEYDNSLLAWESLMQRIGGLPRTIQVAVMTEQIKQLVALSDLIPSQFAWISLRVENGVVWGSVQQSDIGGVDSVPLPGSVSSGADGAFILSTTLLKKLLRLFGGPIAFSTGEHEYDPVLMADAENPNIAWALAGRVLVQTPQTEPTTEDTNDQA